MVWLGCFDDLFGFVELIELYGPGFKSGCLGQLYVSCRGELGFMKFVLVNFIFSLSQAALLF